MEIIDTQASQGGHEMLDRTQFGPVFLKTGGHARIADAKGIGRDIDGRIKVDAMEDDPASWRSGAQEQSYLGARMEADAYSTYDRLESALLQHEAILRAESDDSRKVGKKANGAPMRAVAWHRTARQPSQSFIGQVLMPRTG
jgi:hypothetical protein